jgi:hypothetical protein
MTFGWDTHGSCEIEREFMYVYRFTAAIIAYSFTGVRTVLGLSAFTSTAAGTLNGPRAR